MNFGSFFPKEEGTLILKFGPPGCTRVFFCSGPSSIPSNISTHRFCNLQKSLTTLKLTETKQQTTSHRSLWKPVLLYFLCMFCKASSRNHLHHVIKNSSRSEPGSKPYTLLVGTEASIHNRCAPSALCGLFNIYKSQVRRGCQSKEGECGGWIPRDEPLRFNTPPQPSLSPRREEETNHSAGKGTKGKVKRRPRKRSSRVRQSK